MLGGWVRGSARLNEEEQPVRIPINGTLDLHTFRPSELGDLLPEYLSACRAEGFSSVRIVHGKGTGALREGVHAILKRLSDVERFQLCPAHEGGWGATRAWLKR